MRLVVVGSGTSAPHVSRVCAGNWVEAGPVRMLLDCGDGVAHRMATLGIPWSTVTHVAITHFHIDHVGDLPGLIAALRWGQLPPRAEPLVLIGPTGFADWFDRLAAIHGRWVKEPGYLIDVREMAPDTAAEIAPGVTLGAHTVSHNPESVAYSVGSGRARLVYTGDTAYDDGLATWAAGCDVLLTECSLPASLAVPGHLTPDTAGALAARAAPGRLVLTHFYPPVEQENIAAMIRKRWSGPLVLAQDGTRIDIKE